MPSASDAPAERTLMAQALALAAVAEGCTSPNPRVGCVLVRDGRVIGRGYHRAAGLPHAEAMAVAEAGPRAAGATLYVNLEPCAHYGRTAPCADLLVRCGVRRVVAALQDPNPLVDGKGFAQLRQAGIEVAVGLLADEAARLNAPFLSWHRHGRPLVTLKAAVSLDGMLAAADGASQWISGAAARRVAQRLRLSHDAVLVGAGTLRRDDPRLTLRLPGVAARHERVVLTSRLDVDPGARIFRDVPAAEGGPVRVYGGPRASEAAERALARRARVIRVAEGPGGLDLGSVLRDLGSNGIQSVLVEGGGRIHASFLAAGLAARLALFVSARLLGTRGGTPLVDGPVVADLALAWRLRRPRVVPLGAEWLVLGDLE